MSEPIIFHAGDKITIKNGYYAEVIFKKIETTKDRVLDKLIALDRHRIKRGDLLDLQILARAALHGSAELGEPSPDDLFRAEGSSLGTNPDKSRDSDVKS